MPVVIVSLSPKGLPIAITCCPTCREEEFTIGRGTRFSGEKLSVICNTAISLEGSLPITFALYVLPSTNVTSAVLAPSIQKTVALGHGGKDDYSVWHYNITPNYASLKHGQNKITAKISCIASASNVTKFNSVNVTGT